LKPTIKSMIDGINAKKTWYEIIKPYCRIRTRKSRSRKKWLKDPTRYIPDDLRKDAVIAAMMHMMQDVPRLNYQEIGKKLLCVDELPQGAYCRYEGGINKVYGISPREGLKSVPE
jgi:ferredoxin-thioredoxin reductase catalytic subunit